MQRLGLVGGTFDPIHIGHILLAQFVCEALELDQVLFVPAAAPPHKDERAGLAAAEHRWAMVEGAIAGFPRFRASRLELERPGRSYTIDTLRQLRALHPRSELFLIIGADNIAQISTWHDPEGILALCTVVAGSRPGGKERPADPALAARIVRVHTPLLELSSTAIRRRCARGQSIRYMVPPQVEDYIRRKGVYAPK